MKTSLELNRYQYKMRKNPTKYENICCEKLKLTGIAFKQQMILGFFILDFVIPSKMLVIEVDGSSHDLKKDYDKNRDSFCNECGFSVLRIKNEEILNYDFGFLSGLQDFPEFTFRHGLSWANVIRGRVISGVKQASKKDKVLRTKQKRREKQIRQAERKDRKGKNISHQGKKVKDTFILENGEFRQLSNIEAKKYTKRDKKSKNRKIRKE